MGRKLTKGASADDGSDPGADDVRSEAGLKRSVAKFEAELAKELESINAARAARALAATAIAELARRYAPRTPVGRSGRARGGYAADAPTVEELCIALIQDDDRQRHRVLSRFRAFGMNGGEVFNRLIPAAARRLGELWMEDEIGFTDVALGVARLEETARSNEPPAESKPAAAGERPASVLLWVPSEEEHTLGAFIAASRFRKEGYVVDLMIGSTEDELVSAAEARPFALVGISCGSRRLLSPLATAVERLRGVVAPSVPIILGGPIVEIEPQAAEAIGADGLASDIKSALRRLEKAGAAMSYR
ncbi:cobalamin B12-binding domain-containing protein [Albimonas sp. CAU 1670]|uniref:cobalamin B12-binding domain-containing protein n=1 Tax=Albimonas sp. CAU 1670 TaxID=3032599 RepID=UPI0023DB22C6|nr:cobalamin B12-binding domain-containing protein [Albimonas sp. CAU 1670]MDF2231515.1 cobalamin B12-binding domain-containing protein [Albimonas sp. CAU 1670]